jgi:penicillin-binding protein 2
VVESGFKDHLGERQLFVRRAVIAGVLVVLAMSAVVLKLANLQILDHAHYTTLSRDNRVKIEPLPPTRGLIYDAKGILLAENYPAYSLEITPEKVGDLQETIAELRRLVSIDDKDIKRFARLRKQRRRFEGVPIRFNLTQEEVARVSVNNYRLSGVDVRAELVRYYPLGESAAHVIGYVGRINEQELKEIDTSDYAGTNYIGKTGVEKAYEGMLHGHVGHQQVEVNARGRVIRVLESRPPVPGRDLRLYLDIRLQQAATAALGTNRGAVVAIDPRTGGVLAMVSQPTFDPNLFVDGIGADEYRALRDSPDKPLFNRAIRGQYPPGSTIKPFVALTGLTAGAVTGATTVYCPGFYRLPGQAHKYRDWKHGGHGTVALHKAIVQSCDVYFYELAHDLGIDRLHDFLAQFGFGRRIGLDVAGERPGLLPSKEWKRESRHQPWYPGETLILGIGQGYFLVTPVQLAAAMAAIAAQGRYTEPRVARASQRPGASNLEDIPAVGRQLPITAAHLQEVVNALTDVVESAHGTARRIRTDAYRIAGKTGTAQVFTVGQKERYRASRIPERMRDHALFIAFAPVDNPRIAVAVIVENGGHGGSVAAPVARDVMDSYLGNRARMARKETSDGE